MKKVVIVNGSPRKKWNTAQLLQSAKEGAEAVGAEVTYVELYDLQFTGCRSCLACKRKGIEEPCKCRWKDGLSDVLDKIYEADELIIGSPIYFSEPTAQVRGLLERVVFPALSYDQYGSIFKGKINVSVFLTMNMDEAFYQNNYKALADQYFSPFRLLNGEVKIYPFYDTLQVKDYSKYDMAGFDGDHKQERHKTQFPEDLKEAYRIGNGMN